MQDDTVSIIFRIAYSVSEQNNNIGVGDISSVYLLETLPFYITF